MSIFLSNINDNSKILTLKNYNKWNSQIIISCIKSIDDKISIDVYEKPNSIIRRSICSYN